jgi:hypothetical protein
MGPGEAQQHITLVYPICLGSLSSSCDIVILDALVRGLASCTDPEHHLRLSRARFCCKSAHSFVTLIISSMISRKRRRTLWVD